MASVENLVKLDTISFAGPTRRKKILPVVLVAVLLCLAVIVPISIYFGVKGKSGSESGTKTYEQKLAEAANLMSSAMKSTVDPCEDFYAFSCGNFKRPQAEEGDLSYNRMTIIQEEINKRLKDIFEKTNLEDVPRAAQQAIINYRSCTNLEVNNKDLEKLKTLLQEIGGWPIADFHFSESSYSLFHATAIAIKKASVAPLVTFEIGVDDRNTSRNVIHIIEPVADDIPITDETGQKILIQAAQKLGGISSQISTDLLEIGSLETTIQSLVEKTKKEEGTSDYGLTKIKDLGKLVPGINFIEFFQTLTNDTLNPMNEYLTVEDEVIIKNKDYLLAIANLILNKRISKRTLANYIGAKLILKYPILVAYTQFGVSRHEYEIFHYSEEPEPWVRCLEATKTTLVFATDYLYVINDRNEKDKIIEKTKEMIPYLREAFKTLANKSEWIDEVTLPLVKEKLDAMMELIGYPPWLLDKEKINEYYKNLPDLTDNFALNLMTVTEFLITTAVQELRKINDANVWPSIPTTEVNAGYAPQLNLLHVSLAIENPPIFDPDLPGYLNFAAIGAIIGHEITHGFDSDGSHRDKKGNLRDWWSEKSKKEFLKRTACFVRQFNNYYVEEVDANINGSLTLPENIADSGGLRQAFLAYQNWEAEHGKEKSLPGLEKYSTYELFFLAYASMWCADDNPIITAITMQIDPHSPNQYRVIGTLSNSQKFSDTFKCPAGSKMNPNEKCVIW